MPKCKNSKGYCDERTIDVQKLNLCDYFNGKRKNSKPSCRNCTHFHLLEVCKEDNKTDNVSNDE